MSLSFTMKLHPRPPPRLMEHASFGTFPRFSDFVFSLKVTRA